MKKTKKNEAKAVQAAASRDHVGDVLAVLVGCEAGVLITMIPDGSGGRRWYAEDQKTKHKRSGDTVLGAVVTLCQHIQHDLETQAADRTRAAARIGTALAGNVPE